MRWLGVLAVLFALLVALPPGSRPAAAQVAVATDEVVNGYPQTLTFRVQATAPEVIEEVTLRYSVFGSSSAFTRPEAFEPGETIDVSVDIDVDTGSGYIPVGSVFTYEWELLDANGETHTTEPREYLYLPPDQDWQSVENDFLIVHYHGDREAQAREYLEAVTETYAEMGALLGAELEDVPVRLVLFGDEAELDPARPGVPDTRDALLITCGVQLTPVVIFAIPIHCGTGDRTDTVRHEFTHILVEVAASGPLSVMPFWLNEGTAVLAQSEPGDGYAGAFANAVQQDALIPFNRMNTPPADANLSNLFYGQSHEMVRFLIDEGGEDRFAELYSAIDAGERFDRAIERIYSLDLAGFENEFRAVHGLAPAAAPTTAPTAPPQQAPEPTAAPDATAPAQTGGTTRVSDDDGVSRVAIALVLLAVLFALLGVLAYLFLVMQTRSREQRMAMMPSAAPPDRSSWSTEVVPEPEDREER